MKPITTIIVVVLSLATIGIVTVQSAQAQQPDIGEQFIMQQFKEDTVNWFALDAYTVTEFTAYNDGMNVTIKVQQMGLEYANEVAVSEHFEERGYGVTEYTPFNKGTILIEIANNLAYYLEENEGPSSSNNSLYP